MKLSVTALFLVCGIAAVAQELPAHVSARRTKLASPVVEHGLTNVLIVRTRSALPLGMPGGQPLKSLPNWSVFSLSNADARDAMRRTLAKNANVLNVFVVPAAPIQTEFVPDDPYFVPFGGFRGQWHLKNEVETGRDINVMDAWAEEVTGLGVTVAPIDDGLQSGHEDLFPNYVSANSYDFASGDTNPGPVNTNENHGTAVAGIIAARGGNSLGVTGVAPFASLSGIRVSFTAANVVTQLTDATLFKSSGGDTALKIKNHSYGTAIPFVDYSVLATALETSSAAGTLHIRSAGNYRGTSGEDANKSSDRATPSALVVGAMGNSGVFADYSNFGANLICTAPTSPTAGSSIGLQTTDRSGSLGYNGFPNTSYTPTFGGTSATAPQLAGALALVKEVRPGLNERFAKYLLSMTSVQVDPSDASTTGGWVTNAAGRKFNPNYGFGMINVSALVDAAQMYSGTSLHHTATTGTISVGTAIPDGTGTSIFRAFNIASTHPSQKTEDVVITLNATHPWRGDLEATVTSPAGTTFKFLNDFGGDSGDNLNWKFTVNGFWGEDPDGQWRVTVKDLNSGDAGTWNSLSVDVRMGYLVEASSTISGTVDLLNFTNEPGEVVAYELLNGATVVQSGNMTLGAAGSFAFGTTNFGAYDLRIKGRTWLAKKIAINTSSSVSGLSYSLTNGDVSGDNIVDIADYVYLSANFSLDSSASNWLTPDGNGIRPKESDLNDDGIVDIADYVILSSSFSAFGD